MDEKWSATSEKKRVGEAKTMDDISFVDER